MWFTRHFALALAAFSALDCDGVELDDAELHGNNPCQFGICQNTETDSLDDNIHNSRYYYGEQCPDGVDRTPTWKPGSVNSFFERILSLPDFKAYKPHAHLRDVNGTWLISLDEFVTKEEAEYFIENIEKNRRSASERYGYYDHNGNKMRNGLGEKKKDCRGEHCVEDPLFQNLTARYKHITNIPDNRMENHRYALYPHGGKGTSLHRDGAGVGGKKEPSVLVTMLLYLNSGSEFEGGQTEFPMVDLIFTPSAGQLLIWSNVHDSDPGRKLNEDLYHQGMPVREGTKYIMTQTFRQFDLGCYRK